MKFDDLENVKIRFNLMFEGHWNPVEFYKNAEFETLLKGQYWNYSKKKSFQNGQTTIGFLKLSDNDLWLLFHIGKITSDLNVFNGVGYTYEVLRDYEKFFDRLIIKFKNRAQTMIRLASSVIDECEVMQILPDTFDNDIFPGYDKVRISWHELSRVITKESRITALQNQKGIYLISDRSNGKMYVGSAYGENMILGRWISYVKSGNGGNVEFKKLSFEHIKDNFEYSILEFFNQQQMIEPLLTERHGGRPF